MDKRERKSAATEWTRILKEHPKFARAFLAQQAILMEASELGYRLIDARMCRLLEVGMVVPFLDFWSERYRSSAGVVITGVADRLPDRIGNLVYLDAFVPQDGQSMLDIIPPDRRPAMEALVHAEGKGWQLPRFSAAPWDLGRHLKTGQSWTGQTRPVR